MDDQQLRILKGKYLEKHVFGYLKNLNNGFDAPGIAYFREEDFEMVLHRVQELGLGVYGIEPWMNDEYFDVATFESYDTTPDDPKWYFTAFERFKSLKLPLQYAASYHVDENLFANNI